MENGGKEMLDELYKEHLLDPSKHLQQCDITLAIDTSNIPKTQSKCHLDLFKYKQFSKKYRKIIGLKFALN